MTSFNSKIFDQNFDSISQIGDNTQYDTNSNQIDIGNIHNLIKARDDKIKSLVQEKIKLKNLLKKAKVALDSYGSKTKTAQ